MALYAIGDVQGCYGALLALLNQINFDRQRDRLWFTGDLVNRGPESVAVLRFVAGLGDQAVAVLGNHDLHLLAVAVGCAQLGRDDTFGDVLEAPDRDSLLDWLRRRPLLHHDSQIGYTLVHAGLAPQWDLTTAMRCAEEATSAIRGDMQLPFYRQMYGDMPQLWSDDLRGWDRLRFIINTLTRLRYCHRNGQIDLRAKGAPGTQPRELVPWFQVAGRRTQSNRLVFGHWSALGCWDHDGVIGLDAGCSWGGALAAVRLAGGERAFFRAPCT